MLSHLKGMFAAFVIIGVIVIVGFSVRTDPSSIGAARASYDSTMIVVVLGLMTLYGIILWVRTRTGIASDADGETFYYLGFIFTLATLVATFMPLLWQTTARVDTKQVLGLFGLGLITTFVGLAGRIFFSQLTDSEGTSEAGLQRLAHAADVAGRSIEAVSLQIERASNNIVERQDVAYKKLLADVTTQQAQVSAELSKLAQQAAESIESISEASASRISALLALLEERLGNLQLPSKAVGEQLTKEIQAASIRLKVLGQGVDDASGKLREAGAQFSETSTAIIQAGERLGSFGENTKLAAAATQSATLAYARMVESLEKATGAMTDLSRAASTGEKAIEGSVASMSQDLKEGGVAWREFVGTVAALGERVQQFSVRTQELVPAANAILISVAQAQNAVQAFGENTGHLSEHARSASLAAQSLVSTSEQLTTSLSRLTSGAVEQHANLLQMIREIEADVMASQEAVQKVHQQLVTSASFIVSKLT